LTAPCDVTQAELCCHRCLVFYEFFVCRHILKAGFRL